MVKGLDRCKEYFRDFAGQHVLIGGSACDISFENSRLEFRATKDPDIVLIAEALTKEFGLRFWQFIREGRYQDRARSSGSSPCDRYDKPALPGFPMRIERFARTDYILKKDAELTSIHVDDRVSSLSAILLNPACYQALLKGREAMDGVSILKPVRLIPFKAKAWLDLRERSCREEYGDSRDLKKHRNDIIRTASELTREKCELPAEVKADMSELIDVMNISGLEIKNPGLRGITADAFRQVLTETYLS